MKEVNLLPDELKPKSYAIGISKQLKKYAVLGLVIFFIALMVAGGSLLALNIRKNALSRNQTNLESQVNALRTTEQKLILVQDRLGKINKIITNNNSIGSINALGLFINNLNEGVVLDDVEIESGKLIVSVNTDSSQNLGILFGTLNNLGYKSVSMQSFSYRDGLGYDLNLEIIN